MLVRIVESAFIERGATDLCEIESQAVLAVGAEVCVIKIRNPTEYYPPSGRSTHVRELFDGNAVAPPLISSDLPEIIHLSHRVMIMCDGEIVKEIDAEQEELTQIKIMNYAIGRDEDGGNG